MIFISVGTEKFAFDRLLVAVDEALGRGEVSEEVFAQTGSSQYKPKHFKSEDYISFAQMKSYIQKADVVVMHAGVGSTIISLSLGKIPVLMPRQSLFGEHLDDHQMEFASNIASLQKALVAYDDKELIDCIKHYSTRIKGLHADPSRSKSKSQLVETLKFLVA